ncbi:MAG TPA: phosphate regulon sensor histidine kinase PhoR [Rhodocyclaceae bacterium]|nr:phosphate regulon sensor histidine kinase PhoR [Rhodocyclaceae bacterium]
MPGPIASALVYVVVSAAIGLVMGLMVSSDAGWAAFSVCLLGQLAYHSRQYVLLDRWSQAPSPERELGGEGIWYVPFSRVYRHERELRREIARLHGELARFAAAGQAINDGIVSLDLGGRIEWCNRSAERYLGLDQRTDVGQPIINLVRQPAFVAYLSAGDFSEPLRLRSERSGDCIISIRVTEYGPDRRLIQVKDVTQAERLDQMRRDFVANVSHELRTPLTVLAGFLETFREMELTPEERSHYLALMTEQSERMLRLLQDLLTLSSIESAPPPSEDERIDAAALVDKLYRDAKALSGGRHDIQLETAGLGDLRGSESEISSALGNLVSNAVRYTPAGGRITLRWTAGPEGAEFAVEDTGIGIDPLHLPRLTERFYRVDRGRSRESGGTGLGLSIVKHSLSRHQAVLDIRSTPGKGSRFAARFPAARVVAVEAAESH